MVRERPAFSEQASGATYRAAAPVLTYEELAVWGAGQRSAGLSVGFTCGAFDILHAGHVDYLQRSRALCDRLVVAVNSDSSVRSYKNPLRPIIEQQHRSALVAALACVDAVVIMEETRPATLIELLRPDFYIKGGDYQTGKLRSASLVESYGGQVILIPVEQEISTSAIISRISEKAGYAAPSQPAPGATKPKIVFLDRDGTLIENVPFLGDSRQVRVLPGVPEGLLLLQNEGYLLVVVTNQQGIGLGYFDYQDFVAVNSEMLRQLSPYGIRISRFYYCPHSHAEQCQCRKPGTEMIERALAYFGSSAEHCFLIGDSAVDLQAAQRAGCTGILLKQNASGDNPSEASDFTAAVRRILQPAKQSK